MKYQILFSEETKKKIYFKMSSAENFTETAMLNAQKCCFLDGKKICPLK